MPNVYKVMQGKASRSKAKQQAIKKLKLKLKIYKITKRSEAKQINPNVKKYKHACKHGQQGNKATRCEKTINMLKNVKRPKCKRVKRGMKVIKSD